jgi:uncharacterized coiled-coil protein SlyX
MKAQKALSEELMTIRFTARTIERLCEMVRAQVEDVRKKERQLRRIIVDKCGMPQDVFVKDFPANLLNLKWVEKQAAAGKPWSATMARNIPPVQELQQRLIELQTRVVVPLAELLARAFAPTSRRRSATSPRPLLHASSSALSPRSFSICMTTAVEDRTKPMPAMKAAGNGSP